MMGMIVTAGACCQCSFGTIPCTLQVTSQMGCMADGKPIATIQDGQPGVNLAGFGMCTSLTNPTVAAATAAALGVLTPQPCTMLPAGSWTASNLKALTGGIPCLTSDATLMCGLGAGSIRVVIPGQNKVIVL